MAEEFVHPSRYKCNGIEAWDIEAEIAGAQAFNAHRLLAAVEYVLRYREKNGVEDLKKAKFILNEMSKPLAAHATEEGKRWLELTTSSMSLVKKIHSMTEKWYGREAFISHVEQSIVGGILFSLHILGDEKMSAFLQTAELIESLIEMVSADRESEVQAEANQFPNKPVEQSEQTTTKQDEFGGESGNKKQTKKREKKMPTKKSTKVEAKKVNKPTSAKKTVVAVKSAEKAKTAKTAKKAEVKKAVVTAKKPTAKKTAPAAKKPSCVKPACRKTATKKAKK